MSGLNHLEQRLEEIEDLDSEEWKSLNAQINALYAEREARRLERQKLLEEQRLAEMIAKQELKIESLTEEEVDKMFIEAYQKYAGDINGLSFEDWFKKSTSYYEIDEQFNVIAKARSSNTQEIIPHVSRAHAKFTIFKRVKYKMYDHGTRGHDFAWEKES